MDIGKILSIMCVIYVINSVILAMVQTQIIAIVAQKIYIFIKIDVLLNVLTHPSWISKLESVKPVMKSASIVRMPQVFLVQNVLSHTIC